MDKVYSRLLFFFLFCSPALYAQNVGVGTNNPQEKLDVDGAIRIGNSTNDLVGTIRYNTVLDLFQGRVDTGWVSLVGGGTGAGGPDKDWIIDTDSNMYAGVPGFVGIGTDVPEVRLHVFEQDSFASAIFKNAAPQGVGAIGYGLAAVSVGVMGIGNGKDMLLPPFGSGGAFIGTWGIYGVTDDSTGYGVVGQNLGNGHAGLFIGDMDLQGALRNTDDSLYGGSVAINDGLTVGNIEGATCNPTVSAFGDTSRTFNFLTLFGSGNAPYSHFPSGLDSGQCRKVTNVYFEITLHEQENFSLKTAVYIKNTFIGSVISNADPSLSGFTPGVRPLLDYYPQDIGYTSTWFFDEDEFNGSDPDGVDWSVEFIESSGEGDFLLGFYLKVEYKFGDSTDAPIYAAFGEVRASGTLYANSTNDYGDVAEFFKMAPSGRIPEPGDLVTVSKRDPQAFTLTTSEYDPLMAGVISENPSIYLNDPSEGEPIALTGRVKVKVNLNGGVIAPGDPITSSSVEGVGMKANRNGMILGYALETFDGARMDEGKIWILLARGHAEKLSPETAIYEVQVPALKGVKVSGAKKVSTGEALTFVPWEGKVGHRVPADVEFEDLFIELTPYGGQAGLVVTEVSEKGFYVEVSNAEESFKGFYYSADILTINEEDPKVVNRTFDNYREKVTYTTDIYRQWKDAFHQLQEKSGISFERIKSLNGKDEVNAFKKAAHDKWKMDYPDLFAQWQNAGNEFIRQAAKDPSLVRKVKE